jgi:hypothetical protein
MKRKSAPAGETRNTTTFRFRVQRAFKALDNGTHRKWIVVAPGRELPVNVPLDANARVPNVVKNATCAEMRDTLLNCPDLWQVLNSGIVCTATAIEAKQDGNEHQLEVTFEDGEEGIVNGGHSYAQLLHFLHGDTTFSDGRDLKTVLLHDARKGAPDLIDLATDEQKLGERIARAREKVFVQLEFVAPVNEAELLARIARARNLSQSVEATAFANLAGKFDLMKDVLGAAASPFGPAFVDRVVWKTNLDVDPPAIPVKLLVQVLALMNGRIYPPGTRTANDVYSRTGVVVRAFAEAEGDDEKYFDSLTRILPTLIELYDHIFCSLSDIDPTYPWADGKFDTEKPRKRTPATTPFLAKPCASKVANAFLWPIFSAFRTLLASQPDGSLKFKTDPIALFNEIKQELVTRVQNFHQKVVHGLLHQVGREPQLWARLEERVEHTIEIREVRKVGGRR